MGTVSIDLIVTNLLQRDTPLSVTAVVDTGAQFLTLPHRYKDRFGPFEYERPASVALASGSCAGGDLCGPALISIGGGEANPGNVLFLPDCEGALLGCIPLEMANLVVDVVGYRLIPVGQVSARFER